MKAHCEQGLRKIAAAALLMGVAPVHARAQPETPAGPVSTATSQNPTNTAEDVVAVQIVTEDGRVLSEAPRGLPVSIGKPLDREQVAESIRTLYRTGDYADLRAMSTPVDGGMRVDFVVREQLFFNQVIIHGLVSPPTEASAIAAVQLALGEPFQADTVNEGLERLRELLREEGFYETQVSAQTVPHPENHQMDVVINIEPGVRARIKEIQLKNGTEYRDAEILSRSKLRAGRGLTAAHVQRGTSRVRKFLVKTGHLNARAMVRRGTYDAKSNAIPGAGDHGRAAGADCGDGGEIFRRGAEEFGAGVSRGGGRRGLAGRRQAQHSRTAGARRIFRRGGGVRDEHERGDAQEWSQGNGRGHHVSRGARGPAQTDGDRDHRESLFR